MNPWRDITPEDILRMQDEQRILDEEAERSPSHNPDLEGEDNESKKRRINNE